MYAIEAQEEGRWQVVDETLNYVCECRSSDRAVSLAAKLNTHDALVAALQWYVDAAERARREDGTIQLDVFEAKANDALAAVKEVDA